MRSHGLRVMLEGVQPRKWYYVAFVIALAAISPITP